MQAWKALNKAAEVVDLKERVGTHTLRKTFGYHAYQSGVRLAVLQKLFNHSAPSVTLVYIGITQDELDDVYLNLNLIFDYLFRAFRVHLLHVQQSKYQHDRENLIKDKPS